MEQDALELLVAVMRAAESWEDSIRMATDADQRAAFQAGLDEIERCCSVLRNLFAVAVMEGRAAFPESDRPQGFSSVRRWSDRLLLQLGMNMLRREDIVLPADCAACDPICPPLNAQELIGIDTFLEHHKTQLQKFGVQFDCAGGFGMYNLHQGREQGGKLYCICTGDGRQHKIRRYHGDVDGCLAPVGLTRSGASCASRVVYMHMQLARREQQHQQDSQATQGDDSSQPRSQGVPWSGAEEDQAVVAMLAANAYNSYPLIFDLTDGEVHHLFQLGWKGMNVWMRLTPQQAYWKQAQMLLSDPGLVDPCLALESLPERLREPMEKLRRWRA